MKIVKLFENNFISHVATVWHNWRRNTNVA